MSLEADDRPGWRCFKHYTLPEGSERPAKIYHYMHYNCPCGCGSAGAVPVKLQDEPDPGRPPFWIWNGNEERPTLTPSMRRMSGCKSHVNLTDGAWFAHSDGPPLAVNCFKAGDPVAQKFQIVYERAPFVSPNSQERTVTDQPDPTQAPPALTQVSGVPDGHTKTNHIKFLNGLLHQLHILEEPGKPTSEHWEPIAGTPIPAGLLADIEKMIDEKIAAALAPK